MTLQQFISAVPKLTAERAQRYYPHLIVGFEKRKFTRVQIAHFLAQVGHESGSFRWVKEIWGPTGAQLRYEGRRDLGNTQPGDGKRFMGRGLIQVTGRANYLSCSRALYGDDVLLRSPEILETPLAAVDSAFWFWDLKRLARLNDVTLITRRVNGGVNGLADRIARFDRAVANL